MDTLDRVEHDEDHDLRLEWHPGALRLRSRCRWAGALVALATLLPYEVIDGNPQFLWHLIGELDVSGVIAYLAPAAAGVAAIVASFLARRSTSLAIATLAGLLGAALLIRIGADAAAWEVLPLPESLTRRPSQAILALSLTAAGCYLSFREHSRKVGRWLLYGAVGLAAVFYGMPGRGEAPFATIFRLLGALDELPHWRFKLGFIVLAVLLLWPALVALLGLVHVRWPPRDQHPVIGIVALYGLPLLLGMLVFRALPGAPEGWNVFMAIGGILVLGGMVALLASAIEVAAEGLFAPAPDQHEPEGVPPRRALAIAGAAVALVSLAQLVLALPPDKGVQWTLKAPTAEADAVFRHLLPAWNRARLDWDREARHESGARALLEVKRTAREVVDAATTVDPGLGAAVERMTKGANELHVAGRAWYRMVAEVNDASRAAGLPYYLDPTVYQFNAGGEQRRHFRMRSYRVQRVRRFRAGGREYATLHVDRLDPSNLGASLLGFSRDHQPFAVVALHESRNFERALIEGAGAEPPSCDDSWNPDAREGLGRCGELLARIVRDLPGGVEAAVTALTDRHELQHQIDGPHLPMSGAVLDHLQHRGQEYRERVNRELSAYVAEITAPDVPPHLGLVHLARFALSFEERHYVYHVAIIALEAMAETRLRDADGELDPQALVAAFVALAGLDDAALRARATDAWGDLYGMSLPAVEVIDESVVPEG